MGFLEYFGNINYMYCSLGFITLEFLFDLYLISRQRKTVKVNRTPNEDVKKLMDDDTYVKARLYSLEKINFGIIKDIYNYFELSGVTLTFFMYTMWKFAGKTIQYFGYSDELI